MRVTPDLLTAIAVGAAVVLELVAPLAVLPAAFSLSVLSIGGLLAAAGLALEISAARALAQANTSTRPNDEPSALVTTGPFARSRNPFYLGIVLLIAGVSAIISLDWSIVAVPALWLALDRLVVPGEERKLDAVFGEVFRRYAASTRRWI